jgi:hypothetical protein
MLELLKNSMRATVDWHGVDGDFPAIKVIIADGNDNEDVVIKVSDEGGGIPRSNMKKIWSYLFTTADPAIQEGMVALNQDVDHGIDSPLAGLGYGLPISRSYCRYFGGDLSIMSMEGHGTGVYCVQRYKLHRYLWTHISSQMPLSTLHDWATDESLFPSNLGSIHSIVLFLPNSGRLRLFLAQLLHGRTN